MRLHTRMLSLRTDQDGGFVADTTSGRVRARQVVVASGPYTTPYVPDAAADLDPAVQQLHSSQYRRPEDLPGKEVLVVGAGNSAAQLAVELAATRRVTVAAPDGMWFLPSRVLGVSLYWWIYLAGILNGMSDSPTSRRVRRRGDGIIGRELQELVAAGGVRMVEQRVVGAAGRTVRLGDGTEVQPDAVLWCTGFRPDLGWLDVPGALDADGRPVQDGGRSPGAGAALDRACVDDPPELRDRRRRRAGAGPPPRARHRRAGRLRCSSRPLRSRAAGRGPGPLPARSPVRSDSRRCSMSDHGPADSGPTSKQLRDARRQAHEAQKASASKDRGKKGKKGKGDRTT